MSEIILDLASWLSCMSPFFMYSWLMHIKTAASGHFSILPLSIQDAQRPWSLGVAVQTQIVSEDTMILLLERGLCCTLTLKVMLLFCFYVLVVVNVRQRCKKVVCVLVWGRGRGDESPIPLLWQLVSLVCITFVVQRRCNDFKPGLNSSFKWISGPFCSLCYLNKAPRRRQF